MNFLGAESLSRISSLHQQSASPFSSKYTGSIRPPTILCIAWIESEKAAERVQPQRPPECFREQLSDEWFDVLDFLTITDVSDVTGYTPNAVDN